MTQFSLGQITEAPLQTLDIAGISLPLPADVAAEWMSIYIQLVTQAAHEMSAFPGFSTVHILMAERVVHAYVRQRSFETIPTEWYVLKAWQDQLRGLLRELYGEARAMAREDVWRKNLLESILKILREELGAAPELLHKIVSRFRDLA